MSAATIAKEAVDNIQALEVQLKLQKNELDIQCELDKAPLYKVLKSLGDRFAAKAMALGDSRKFGYDIPAPKTLVVQVELNGIRLIWERDGLSVNEGLLLSWAELEAL